MLVGEATRYDVFLATAMSEATATTTDLADALEAALAADGLAIYRAPALRRRDGGRPRSLSFAANRHAIECSSAMVLLAPERATKSSVWIEFGMAIAWSLPVLVLVGPGSELPSLAAQALDPPSSGGSEVVAALRWSGAAPDLDEIRRRVTGLLDR